MNAKKNTSVRKSSAFTAKRFAVGAASLAAATALVGVGAQGAFATTVDGGASGSGSTTHSSAHAWGSVDDQHGLFTGHLSGSKAQAIAKRVAADKALFSLLPDALQKDVTALAEAPSSERTADAEKVVSTALHGGYGTAIKDLATHVKDARGTASHSREHSGSSALPGLPGLSGLKGVLDELRDGDFSSPELGDDGAAVAAEVTGDAQLAAKLPASLRTDLGELATAPTAARTGDVQRIAATALSGGYGADIQQLAQQLEQHLTAGE